MSVHDVWIKYVFHTQPNFWGLVTEIHVPLQPCMLREIAAAHWFNDLPQLQSAFVTPLLSFLGAPRFPKYTPCLSIGPLVHVSKRLMRRPLVETWTTSFDWKHATCPLVAGKIWPLLVIIVNIRNISIYIMIWRDMIWWDFSSFVSKHEHDQTCVLRSFSSSNVKTGCSSTLWLACAHQEHFVNGCQRSLVQFSRNYVVQQGFVASPWKKFPQAPAVATKTYLPQHFLFCFFKPCLSTQKGRRA
jgi:hypothetical protein